MKNYFRITGYCPEHDFSFIIDSNGAYEKLWQFSSMLIQKGLKIIEVSKVETMIDINIKKVIVDTEHIFLQATADGKPQNITQTINGITYKAIKVADKIFVQDNEQTV